MHIISKYKDFYDSIVGQVGIDKSIIFERLINDFWFDTRGEDSFRWNKIDFPHYSFSNKLLTETSRSYNLFLVGFCGKMYIAAKINSTVKTGLFSPDTKVNTSFIYGLDNIKADICKYKEDPDYFKNKNLKEINHIESFVNNKNVLELFYTYKTPQFVLYPVNNNTSNENLHINAALKDVQFFKVFDPFQAYQEIEMYITGVLGINNKPMIEIADKHKIIGHGFDYKYSFRKEPTKK